MKKPKKLSNKRKASPAVALQRLVRRLRRVSEMMRQVGADMEYHGGFGEIGEHGRCMIGASQMAKSWADGIAFTLEIKRNISFRVKTPNG
jgi:hypothetical protein